MGLGGGGGGLNTFYISFVYVPGPDTCTTIDLKHYFSFFF